jgi:hypothetical protein
MVRNIRRNANAWVMAIVFAGLAVGFGMNAQAESPDGWKPTGAETMVFVAKRDDGRTVGVHARPAMKGTSQGTLVRVTLSGFADKSLALRQRDVPELYANYSRPIHWWVLERLPPPFDQIWLRICKQGVDLPYVMDVFKKAGALEAKVSVGIDKNLSAIKSAKAFATRSDAIALASRSGGNLTDRFVAANSRTVQNVGNDARGVVVRAIHSALSSSGAK